MRIAITGADRPLGALLCRRLAADRGRTVVPLGTADLPGHDLGGAEAYRRVDLRLAANVALALRGADAVVHAQPHDPPAGPTRQRRVPPDAEQEVMDLAARGTYVLVQAAREAHIGRLVLVSQLALLADYPEDFLVGEAWMPRPRPEGASLAPYLAELVCREIARAGKVEVVCLRMGVLDAPDGTSADDAVAAVEQALGDRARMDGYSWRVQHVVSGGRFARPGRRSHP